MGIQGLLGLLKEVHVPCHVREYAGKTVAVDAYVWLHRGAYSCPEEIATGQATTRYVNYAMHRVRMLKHFNVKPFLVFDGALLPSKMGTEHDRQRRRTEALARANAFVAEGKASMARDAFAKAVDVTPEMAYQLIKALRSEGVDYVVAPYEADPQLAYLERQGIVDAVISEDSDLLVFGCRNVLFKMDGDGNCLSVSRDDFTKCREFNFSGWSNNEFRQMAILSGCDYLDSIPGMGLKTAHRLMRRYKTAEKVVQFVRLEGQLKVPRTYIDDFKRAELTFLHQHVFDPRENRPTHLEPLPPTMNVEKDLPFIGAPISLEEARGIATGDINPLTRQPIVDLHANEAGATAGPSTTLAPENMCPTKVDGTASFYRAPQPAKKAPVAKGKAAITNFFKPVTPAVSTKLKGKGKATSLVAERGAASIEVEPEVRVSKFFGGKTSQDTKENLAPQPEPQRVPSSPDMATADTVEETVDEPLDAADLARPPSSLANHLSSPPVTPMKAVAVKAQDSCPAVATKQERVPAGRHAIITSDFGVSSPADFRGGKVSSDGIKDEAADPTETLAHVSSPVAARSVLIKTEKPERQVKPHPNAGLSCIELSSDPIDLSSEPVQASTRPAKKARKQLHLPINIAEEPVVARPTKRSSPDVFCDDALDGQDGSDNKAGSIVAAWKAKYMLNARTPKPVSSGASSLPTPLSISTNVPSKKARPSPPDTVDNSTKRSVPSSKSRRLTRQPAVSGTPSSTRLRAPLSPRSLSRLVSSKSGRCTMNADLAVQACAPVESGAEVMLPPSDGCGGGGDIGSAPSSGPDLVMNPKLLRFKYAAQA